MRCIYVYMLAAVARAPAGGPRPGVYQYAYTTQYPYYSCSVHDTAVLQYTVKGRVRVVKGRMQCVLNLHVFRTFVHSIHRKDL